MFTSVRDFGGFQRMRDMSRVAPRVVCVVVTHDRPHCLARCRAALQAQTTRPHEVIVIDNASGPETAEIVAAWPGVVHIRQPVNAGGAAGYVAGIAAALARGAEFVWLMDDDGRPADAACLEVLLRRAVDGVDVVAPIVLDEAEPSRLSFPIRLGGRTVFDADQVRVHGPVPGFAHLFNGALIRRELFAAIGLPDERFFIRGDEVDFLYRARAHGASIELRPEARFLHPSSESEIFPILFGRFYAVVPSSSTKRFYLFRNRAFIFRRHRMWLFLAMDVVRYASFFLFNRRGDFVGFARWAGITVAGMRGGFMKSE